MSAPPLGEGGLSQMMVCFETGRAPLGRKGRNCISSVRRVLVYPMPRQFPRTTCRRYDTPGSSAKPGRKGKDQRWKKSEIVVAEVEAFVVRGHDRHCAN